MNLTAIEMRTNEATRDGMMGGTWWYCIVPGQRLKASTIYELLYKSVPEFLPVDKAKLGSQGNTLRYLRHIDTIGIAWHTLSICDLH